MPTDPTPLLGQADVMAADGYNEGSSANNLLNPEKAIDPTLIKFCKDWGNLERYRHRTLFTQLP
ncbi:hypothetical protein [Chamaesiphon minutus]|uniref:hypothetical protein n=1 Tax=Chamaesiphon minutus TaxID=1173032 RepID=UPI0005A131D0|nr:hypothetical protein [Chamaesiphon minutus]